MVQSHANAAFKSSLALFLAFDVVYLHIEKYYNRIWAPARITLTAPTPAAPSAGGGTGPGARDTGTDGHGTGPLRSGTTVTPTGADGTGETAGPSGRITGRTDNTTGTGRQRADADGQHYAPFHLGLPLHLPILLG
jgi:hypothetical protein